MEISSVSCNPSFDTKHFEKNVATIKEEIGEVVKTDKKDLENKIVKANKMINSDKTHLKFEIHEKTHDVMIKIIQSDTGEVIRELPPEKLVDMIAKICEMAGLFIDKKI
ncbi:MAG: flagellar protein FlaG [Clostridium sp.]|uniref:flagellar protein FlaG n=1 Tax=Clostridium sp. TaxID=1506 RepID=UPI002FC9C05F